MGFGEETFENFLRMSRTPMEVIEKNVKICLGGHKAFGIARVALNKEILLIPILISSKQPCYLLKSQ